MIMLIEILLAVFIAPLVGGLLTGIDRILTARMQSRKGPPLLQPFYDVIKLLQKSSTTVNPFTRFFTTFSLFFTIFAVVLLFIGQDLLLCIFAFTLAMIFFVVMGYSGYSPYSFIGAERELIQIMCYEPMILIMAFGFYESTGSFKISETFLQPAPVITKIPLIFFGFIFILTIKLRKSPFDLSMSHHGHQEIVKGITTELTGICMAMVEITHWYETVFSLALCYVFFIWANPYSHILAISACIAVYFIEIVIDNIFARLKWANVLKTSWIVTAAASLANFIILGLIKI